MAITVVGVTTGADSFGTVTLSSHANTISGDQVIAICSRDEGYGTNAWTGNPFGASPLQDQQAGHTAGTGGRLQIWGLTTASNGATSYSYTESTNNSTGVVHLITVRGANTAVAANGANQNNASSGTPTSPSVGTGTLDLLICGWGALANNSLRTWGVASSGLTTLGEFHDSTDYYSQFAAYGLAIAAGSKTISLSPAAGSRAAAIYLTATASASTARPPTIIAPGLATVQASTW